MIHLKGIESFPGNLFLCERLHSASVSRAVQCGRSDKHVEEETWKNPAVDSTSEARMGTVWRVEQWREGLEGCKEKERHIGEPLPTSVTFQIEVWSLQGSFKVFVFASEVFIPLPSLCVCVSVFLSVHARYACSYRGAVGFPGGRGSSLCELPSVC